MYCQVENRILGSNRSYNLIEMCMCVYGRWMMNSFLHMILSSPFEIFVTWAVSLYSLLFFLLPVFSFFLHAS
jgi:hypothetical protein